MIYLDHNATTAPLPEVNEAVLRAQRELWGNPSSTHRAGQAARAALELARRQTARLIGAKPVELVLTSGGTESNAIALAQCRRWISTAVEHAAVREPLDHKPGSEALPAWMPVDLRPDGAVDLAALTDRLEAAASAAADAGEPTVGCSIQWANNETGRIQPMPAIGQVVAQVRSRWRGRGVDVLWHSDATQAVGKLPVDVAAIGVDLMSFAAHKFHGPKGVGGLYVRRGVRLRPVQLGGPQELSRRGGTENTPGVIGMGVAAEAAAAWLAGEGPTQVAALRDRFERAVLTDHAGAVVHHAGEPRLWNTACIGFPGLSAEGVLVALSERGVCVSAGAACSSGSLEPSPVLRAFGVPEPAAFGSVRFSLGRSTTDEEVDAAAAAVQASISTISL